MFLIRSICCTLCLLVTLCCCTIACSHPTKKNSSQIKLYLQADPFSLDPRIGGDRRSQILTRELFEGLTRIGPDGNVELATASSCTISKDGLVYTFILKHTLWSNGEPVTAYDFEYAWKSILDPSFTTPFSYAFYVIKNGQAARSGKVPLREVGIKALNEQTLEVTLEHPAPFFYEFTSNPLFSPVYRDIASKDPQWASKTGDSYVTNGPFILKERVSKSHIILEKNQNYSRKHKPSVDILSFDIIEDPMTAYALYCQGELDWIGDPFGTVPLEVLKDLNESGKLIKKSTGKLCWLVVGTKNPKLHSSKIRKAIATAINRKELCSYLLQVDENAAFSYLPKKLSMINHQPFEDNNPSEAKKLFEQGLKEISMTKKNYPGIVITHWSDPTEKAVAQALQQQLIRALDIPVTLASYDWSTFFKKVTSGDIEIAPFGWYPWYNDPIYNLEYIKYANNGINGTQWEDVRYINLLDQANKTIDPDERKIYMQEAEELAMKELPIIPLFTQTYKYAKSEGLTGEALSSTGIMELKGLKEGKKR